MRRLAEAKEGDDNGETDRDLSGSDGDDEKDEYLRVVNGQTIWLKAKAREGDERKVGRVEHQLERHQDDDEIAPQQHPGEPDREQDAADDEIMVERDHVSAARACSTGRFRRSRREQAHRRFERTSCRPETAT